MDCIFCKIVGGEIPCQKLYEDQQVIAFLDILPAGRGHSLVVPKTHYANLLEAPPESLGQLIQVVQRLAAALTSALKAEGFNLFMNNGEAAGQKVPHLHFHILPRYSQDGLKLEPPQHSYNEGEIEQIRKQVIAALDNPSREELTNTINQLAHNRELNCAQAINLARQHQIDSKDLGALLDRLQVKVRNCQLGCF